MELNRIVFPSPTPSYTAFTLNRLMWIPRTRYFSFKTIVPTLEKFEDLKLESKAQSEKEIPKTPESNTHIPILYHPHYEGSKNFLIYFHGNAEDIGYASEFTRRLGAGLKVNVISVEYPGYGAYSGDSNAQTILEDAEIVFDFLTHEVGIGPEHIFIFGRSIGSGPATHLASHRNPGMLILMSPYTSIRNVVKDLVGNWATYLIADRFKNIEEISKVKCPVFLIHGKQDSLISWEHSRQLFEQCKAVVAMNISDNMTHNDFSMSQDIIKPIKKFFRQVNIKYSFSEDVNFPEYIKKVPHYKYDRATLKKATSFVEGAKERKIFTKKAQTMQEV